ncbi:MAG: hypothetical protein ACI8S6_004103, partial [Myxococcota bacterium]
QLVQVMSLDCLVLALAFGLTWVRGVTDRQL